MSTQAQTASQRKTTLIYIQKSRTQILHTAIMVDFNRNVEVAYVFRIRVFPWYNCFTFEIVLKSHKLPIIGCSMAGSRCDNMPHTGNIHTAAE